ncbi:hypothetical protein BUALT_Bualt14G0003700 [Buddleja alternifolia]|uniref:Uncharacterized protein n=1 Tax=Buddleja alternifolia TaxID=168488 RepID=A0AAV6WKE6_9LAMI|nr:hypothetical protein BUALT_Bualt14G0003700 [Buddleja alternifolia]
MLKMKLRILQFVDDPPPSPKIWVVDSNVLGYLGEDSMGNRDNDRVEGHGEFGRGIEMGTDTGTKMVPNRDSEGDSEGDNKGYSEGDNEENSDEECSDFYDSEYIDDGDSEVEGEKDGEGVVFVPTKIEPIPQLMPDRESSTDSEGEEREDLVDCGDNLVVGKILTVKGLNKT